MDNATLDRCSFWQFRRLRRTRGCVVLGSIIALLVSLCGSIGLGTLLSDFIGMSAVLCDCVALCVVLGVFIESSTGLVEFNVKSVELFRIIVNCVVVLDIDGAGCVLVVAGTDTDVVLIGIVNIWELFAEMPTIP